ncbi:MAG TPA: choice-of-anchor D domain-containing protein [Kofleriaceae bacterium]
MSKRWPGLLIFLVLIGGGRLAQATVTANPTTVEFGSAAIGGTANGSSTLTTDAGTVNATVALTAGCDFSTMTTAVTITATASPVSFKFMPTAAGSRSCTATVTDTSDGSTVAMITLHGTGTGTAMITVTPGPLDFMNVGVGETSGKLHVTATNNGTDVLQISAANIVNTASNYVITGNTGAQTVAVGAKADWDIQCKPGAMGSVNDVFRISSNATGSPSDTVLKCNGQQGVLAVSTTAIDFGSVALNGMATMNVTLSNTGNVAVTGIGYTLDNTNVGYAVVDTTVPAMLAAGDSKAITIKFAPTTKTDGATSHVTFKGTWTVGSAHNITAPAITLTGKTIALILSTQTLTFGDFRYDAMPKLSFTLKNDGTGDALISSITLTADTGTQGSELPFTITLNGSTASLATPLHAGEQYVIEVIAKPANRTGAIGGKIVVASANITLAPVAITGNATAAMFATTDASFGAVDVQGAAQLITVTIKNSDKATANLDVSAVSIKSKSGTDAAFTFTLPGPKSIAPNTEIDIPVMYLPTVARPAGDADTVVLQATLTGALNGPATMAITLTGRGIDRHLVLPAAAPAFPATFRNPGDTAPVVPVTIQNSGEAPMTVAGVMLSGNPVWQLVDPDPVTIPGGGSHDFMIRFAPNDVGPAPRGQVTFTTNDTAAKMAAIQLDGMGLGRAVQFGPTTTVQPRTVNIGVTGANIPLTLDDALLLTSMDPSNSFRVHRIELEPGPFKVEDAPDNDTLMPSEVKRYAVTLDSSRPGHFEAMATLYLDQDPVPQSQVVLTGDTVYVEAHGGGGCDAGGGTGGLVLGLAALGARRRRRAVAS